MKYHKACVELINLYRSYIEREDQDFRLWDEDDKAHFIEGPNEEGAFKIRSGQYGFFFLSEMENPLKLLKSLRIVQFTTIVANGKVVPVKTKKRVNHEC
jgi:hypothetical protein